VDATTYLRQAMGFQLGHKLFSLQLQVHVFSKKNNLWEITWI